MKATNKRKVKFVIFGLEKAKPGNPGLMEAQSLHKLAMQQHQLASLHAAANTANLAGSSIQFAFPPLHAVLSPSYARQGRALATINQPARAPDE